MRPVKSKICVQCTTLPFVQTLSSRELQSYQKRKHMFAFANWHLLWESDILNCIWSVAMYFQTARAAFQYPQKYLVCIFSPFS